MIPPSPPHETTVLTDRFDRALVYATHVHGGQVRKGKNTPYVAHLLAVAAAVLEHGGNEDLAIAALLHDAAEDQGGERRLEDIRQRFGARVAAVVEACSDSLQVRGGKKEEWSVRKKRYLHHLRTSDDMGALLVSLSDKLHNARAILRDLRDERTGPLVWERFNQPRSETLWYYNELSLAFRDRQPGPLSDELAEIVAALERDGH